MYPKAFMYLIVSTTVCGCASVDLKDFYPFGELNGDTVLPRGENQCDSVIMKFPYQYSCNMSDTEFFISTNGILSTNKSFCSFSNSISPYDQLNNFDRLNNNGLAFAPFLTFTSTATFGTVQFRVTRDADVLKRVNNDISDTGLLSYNAINTLIVTWIDMTFAAYTGDIDSTPKNSFQAVLTTDGYYIFAIFYYNKITWNQGDYSAPCTGDKNTGIGISCPAATGYSSQISNGLFRPNSLLMNSSNVNRPGIWISAAPITDGCQQLASIKPAYINMMGHRSIKVIVPGIWKSSFTWGSVRNCRTTFTSHDVTDFSCYLDVFGSIIGRVPISFLYANPPIYNSFGFSADVFFTPPVPEVYINVLNVTVIDYSVCIELKWNAPLIAELNPGCETVNISMHLFNPTTQIWKDSILIMQSVNNSGGLDIKLVEPIARLFLSEHLLFGVTGNVGSNFNNQNIIFSKMFIFDLDNFNLKRELRSLRNANVLTTVDMLGHRKLNISYRTTPGQHGLGCSFGFDYSGSATQAIASSDNQYVTCYVPFLLGYGFMDVNLENDNYVILKKFIIDVLPSYPRLAVEQVGARTKSNGQFQVQMQFTWDPSEIPNEYPVLNAFIYQYDDDNRCWKKELMVNTQDIPPNAGGVPVTLSQEAITVYFNYKVMFGLGYVQGNENFVIFSKMYIPGVSK